MLAPMMMAKQELSSRQGNDNKQNAEKTETGGVYRQEESNSQKWHSAEIEFVKPYQVTNSPFLVGVVVYYVLRLVFVVSLSRVCFSKMH